LARVALKVDCDTFLGTRDGIPRLLDILGIEPAVIHLNEGHPALAHHAISAEFDTTKPIKFEGTVQKVDWMNPHIYVNIEDKNEIVEIDAKNALVSKRYSIAPCDGPSGLTFDLKKVHLYSVCSNKMMIVSDPATGKVLATPATGAGTDGVAFDDGYAFSANGGDSNITMVGETSPGKFEVVGTIATTRGARTIAADQKAHKLYLPAQEFGPPAEGKDGKKGKNPASIPDSFGILVVGR